MSSNQSGKPISELMSRPIPHPVFAEVIEEVCQAQEKHTPQHSAHESYAVIKEELDEFWAEVMKKREERDPKAMRRELIQIAAMACRAVIRPSADVIFSPLRPGGGLSRVVLAPRRAAARVCIS